MQIDRFQGSSPRRGMALLYACFGVIASATAVSIAVHVAMSSSRQAATSVRSTRAEYLAEGAVEQAKVDVITAIANWENVPTAGTVDVPGLGYATTQLNYSAGPTGFSTISTDSAGIQTIVTGYELRSTATLDGFSHTAHRLVNAEATPIFQFAVFYTGDLEINPGPSMTLGGRVHTNGDMYLNCGGTLTMSTNYVHAIGEIFRNRKDDLSISQGTVKILQWVANPFNAAEPTSYVTMNSQSQMTSSLGYDPLTGYDSDFTDRIDLNGDGDCDDTGEWWDFLTGALKMWDPPDGYTGGTGATVLTGEHGLTQAAVPNIGSIKMFESVAGGSYAYNVATSKYEFVGAGNGTHAKGFYHENAGLSVITLANGTVKVYDSAGTDITSSVSTAISTTSIYDARQAGGGAGNVPITQIDLSVLSTLGKWPANGLLYAASYGADTGTSAKGVRLVNGSTLPQKLTVVSENSLYIKGDFNTVNKKGAAVIADAVNLLSNSWNDTKTSATALPTASTTTYNVAIITGNTNTVVNGAYNGGLENLPRFHENWSSKTCRITGSFVNAWTSEYATSPWQIGGKFYQAPSRVWNYDTAFNTVANLPPFTPMAVVATEVCAW